MEIQVLQGFEGGNLWSGTQIAIKNQIPACQKSFLDIYDIKIYV